MGLATGGAGWWDAAGAGLIGVVGGFAGAEWCATAGPPAASGGSASDGSAPGGADPGGADPGGAADAAFSTSSRSNATTANAWEKGSRSVGQLKGHGLLLTKRTLQGVQPAIDRQSPLQLSASLRVSPARPPCLPACLQRPCMNLRACRSFTVSWPHCGSAQKTCRPGCLKPGRSTRRRGGKVGGRQWGRAGGWRGGLRGWLCRDSVAQPVCSMHQLRSSQPGSSYCQPSI